MSSVDKFISELAFWKRIEDARLEAAAAKKAPVNASRLAAPTAAAAGTATAAAPAAATAKKNTTSSHAEAKDDSHAGENRFRGKDALRAAFSSPCFGCRQQRAAILSALDHEIRAVGAQNLDRHKWCARVFR
jgi:hypothetical protein